MIIRFRNLGIIESADIDITKPFILFTGPNGTGKTYLSYVLSDLQSSFGGFFLRRCRQKEGKEVLLSIYDPSRFEKESVVEGVMDPEILYNLFRDAVEDVSTFVLSDLLIKNDKSEPFSMELVSSIEDWRQELFNMKLDCGFFLRIEKKPGTMNYKVTALDGYTKRLEDGRDHIFEMALFLNSVFFSGASKTTMFTAERTGIALFSKELALGRLKADTPVKSRYPRPINISLSDSEDRAEKRKYKTVFADLSESIERRILKGRIKCTSDGDLRLNSEGKEFELMQASSTSKALADIVFYIRHSAMKMSRLIIDEPEIHLHPDNQLLLARVFAQMVNRGLQLVISTHSDYIIRELNNLIMLRYVGEEFKEKAMELGYNPDDYLDDSLIQPYLFVRQPNGRVRTEAIKVGKDGFSIKSIDSTISSLNEAAEEIYYAMIQNN